MEYIVILIAALFHAVWSSIIKESGDRLLTLAAIRATGLLYGLFIVFFFPPLETAAFLYLFAAAVILFLYYGFLLHIYRIGDFSQVYPIARGSAPLIVVLLGALLAGEYLLPMQIAAVGMISIGIVSLSLSRGRTDWLPAGYALATALCIAGYTVASGIGVRIADSFLVYSGWLELVTGSSVVVFAGIRRRGRMLVYFRRNWLPNSMAGILSLSAFVAALWAMRTCPLGPISALRETSILFAALIGTFVLQEGDGKRRIPAACIVVTGIAILMNSG